MRRRRRKRKKEKKLIELRRCHTYVDVKLTRVYVNKKIGPAERERKEKRRRRMTNAFDR